MFHPTHALSHFELGKALYDDRDLGPAIEAFTASSRHDPELVWGRYALAAALELKGDREAAAEGFANLHVDKKVFAGAVDSARYASSHRTPSTRFFVTTREMLDHALDEAKVDGLVLEFGVRFGISTRQIAKRTAGKVHGFDSFQGLPETWHIVAKGAYSTGGERPVVPENVELHVGLFDETLPRFAAEHPGPLRLVNVDCDLYRSTKQIFDVLADRIVPGTILVFDEYLINDAWREDEFKAFQELVAARDLKYEYLAMSLFSGQAIVQIL